MKIRLILAGFIMCAMNTMPEVARAEIAGYVQSCVADWWLFDVTPSVGDMDDIKKTQYTVGGAGKCSDGIVSFNYSSNEYFFTKVHGSDSVGIIECDDKWVPAGSYIYVFSKNELYRCNDGTNWVKETVTSCPPGILLCSKAGMRYQGTSIYFDNVGIYPVGNQKPCICGESNVTSSSGSTNSGNSKCQKGDKTYASVGQEFNINCDSDLYEVSGPLSSTDNLKNNDMGSGNCKGTCTKDGWNITINDSRCAEGYKPSSDKKQCVQSTNTGNDSGGSSSSGSSSSGSSSSGGSTGGGSRRSGGGGGSSGGTIDTGAETACISTGGTWTKKTKTCTCDNAKHLIYNNKTKECVCNVGYALDTRTNECVATSQTQCETKGKDTADWIDGKCVCKEPDMIWSSNGCVVNPGKTKCDRVSGAKWTGTECKCTTDGYVVNEAGTQCVKSAALIKTEGQAASRTKIISLYKKLNGMSNDFKVSVWKDAEGNFNTARLASDSIAAVVLGTTGALVTSNIVKKNQVSSGFEDINCQIGGQTVASWGDEFSVGMQ